MEAQELETDLTAANARIEELKDFANDQYKAQQGRIDDARARIAELEADLERERNRLAACGVVALSDTTESAKQARDMHSDYESASCNDVARRVDECITLRAELARLKAEWKWIDDHAAALIAESSPIADSGDYSEHWAVYEFDYIETVSQQALGRGDTPLMAVRDAMKDPEDPTRYEYIPPEFHPLPPAPLPTPHKAGGEGE